MARHDDYPRVEVDNAADWRAWLQAQHDHADGAWLVSFKKATGKPAMSYDEAVEQALCFGWVDSLPRKLDAERSMLLFTPRKPTSRWSRPNKERIARMEAAGEMTPAGRRLVDAAQANGSWTALDDVENLVVPDDLADALRARPGATEQWNGFPRSARRGILEWILDAKRPATRSKRVAQTADDAAEGKRANQWRG